MNKKNSYDIYTFYRHMAGTNTYTKNGIPNELYIVDRGYLFFCESLSDANTMDWAAKRWRVSNSDHSALDKSNEFKKVWEAKHLA